MSIKVGTTNTDGTGSATNLSDTNEVLASPYIANSSNTIPGEVITSVNPKGDTIHASAIVWNGRNTKEVKIDAENTDVVVENFVDIDINAQGSQANIDIKVFDAKRGEVHTGEGNDNVLITARSNSAAWNNTFVVDTGFGNDSVVIKDSVNSQFTSVDIDAGAGNDTIDIRGLAAGIATVSRVIDAGHGDDEVFGSGSADIIFGGTGNDSISSYGGDDFINAGSGNDEVIAGLGDDEIYGGSGDDILMGGEGNDTISGGFGDDIINGGTGNDILFGDEGNDTFVFDFTQNPSNQFIQDIGNDVVMDLEIGDTLSFLNVFDSGASDDVFSAYYGITVVDNGTDVKINIDANNSILLSNMGTAGGTLDSLYDLSVLGINIDLT